MLVVWVTVWIAVAVSYPTIQTVAGRLVDRFVLERPDHEALRARLTSTVADARDTSMLWTGVIRDLDAAFDATGAWHCQIDETPPGAPSVLLGAAAREWASCGAGRPHGSSRFTLGPNADGLSQSPACQRAPPERT